MVRHENYFKVADYESEVENEKFKMADLICSIFYYIRGFHQIAQKNAFLD